MNRYSIIICSTLLLISACKSAKNGGRQQDSLPGLWQSTPIAIDGDNKDWPSPYPNYDSKSKIGYATSNDRKYIYITMETGDELTQLKMLKGGMTVSIDTGGKKNADFKINYPLENDNADLDLPQREDGQKDAAIQMQRQVSKNIRKGVEAANQFTIDGFAGCNGGYMVAQNIPCGVKLKQRLDEYKEIVWEAAIPVKALYNKDSLSAADAGKPISVCFAIKGLKAPKAKTTDNANNNVGAMGTGGRSNLQSGGKGGGMGRTKQEDPLSHLYSSTKTWKQFSLTYQ